MPGKCPADTSGPRTRAGLNPAPVRWAKMHTAATSAPGTTNEADRSVEWRLRTANAMSRSSAVVRISPPRTAAVVHPSSGRVTPRTTCGRSADAPHASRAATAPRTAPPICAIG